MRTEDDVLRQQAAHDRKALLLELRPRRRALAAALRRPLALLGALEQPPQPGALLREPCVLSLQRLLAASLRGLLLGGLPSLGGRQGEERQRQRPGQPHPAACAAELASRAQGVAA